MGGPGRGPGLSTPVVFLSLLFWGPVLGAAGMLLSVPLTITAKIAPDTRDETRWAAVLLGPESIAEPASIDTAETVAVRAHDSVHGYGGKTATVVEPR